MRTFDGVKLDACRHDESKGNITAFDWVIVAYGSDERSIHSKPSRQFF